MTTNSTTSATDAADRPRRLSRSANRRRYLVAGIVLTVGVAISVAVFFWARHLEDERVASTFQHSAEARINGIQAVVARAVNEVQSVRALYNASDHVGPDEFSTFVQSVLEANPRVVAVAWLPRVAADARRAFEARVSKELQSPFTIWQRDASGQMVAVAGSGPHFPILYSEPKPATPIIGLDLSAEATRRRAIEEACRTGHPAAANGTYLLGRAGKESALLIFLPVYRKGAVPDIDRSAQSNVEGVIEGVFRIGSLVEEALAGRKPEEIDIQIADVTDSDSPRKLWGSAARSDAPVSPLSDGKLIVVGGRTWQVRCLATREYVRPRRHPTPWLAAGLGLLITLFLWQYLLTLIGRTQRIEATVQERTAQLQQSNEDLREEILRRQQAEKLGVIQRDLALQLGSIPELEDALDAVLATMCRVDGIDCGGVYLLSEHPEDLHLLSHRGLSEAFVAQAERLPWDDPRTLLMRRGDPIYLEHQQASPDPAPDIRAEGLRCVAAIPITDEGGNVIAALSLASRSVDAFSPATRHTLETTAGQIGTIIWRTRAEAILRHTFATARDAIFWIAPETGRLLRWNLAAEHLLQRPAGELDSAPFTITAPPERIDEYKQIFESLAAEGGGAASDIELLTGSGQIRFVDLTASLAHVHGKRILQVILHDMTDRKAAEQALRESEEKFRFLAENASDIYYSIDPDGIVRHIGPQVAQYGYRAEDILGRNLFDLLSPDDRSRVAAEFAQTLDTGEEHPMEARFLAQDGTIHWFEELGAVQRDASGRAVAITGILRNIDERKAAEQALRENEQRYRSLFENSPVSLWEEDFSDVRAYIDDLAASGVTDLREHFREHPHAIRECTRRMRITDVNTATVQLFGADSKEQLLGELARLTTDESLEAFADEVASLAQGRRIWEAETVNRTLSGEVRDVSIHLAMVSGCEEDWSQVLVSIVDITDRRRAERALRDSEEQYRTLVENVNFGIYRNTGGPQGRFLQANPAIARIFGYDGVEAFLQVHVSDLYQDPEDRHAFVEDITRTGYVSDRELRLKKKDGTPIWCAVTARITWDDDGNIRWMDGVIEDVTERHEAQAALQSAHRRLMTAREEERRHLAGELHDSVSQALVAMQLSVRNAADLVCGKVETKTVDALRAAGQRCSELVREVRQICHGLYPPALSSLGLIPGLRQLARESEQAGLKTTVDVTDDVAAMRFTPDVEIALFRTAQEAVNNALRHSQATHIILRLRYHQQEVVLRIIDNGKGFDPTIITGNGLGLATMKERAGAVNGRLQIDSAQKRTRIAIFVPAQPISP